MRPRLPANAKAIVFHSFSAVSLLALGNLAWCWYVIYGIEEFWLSINGRGYGIELLAGKIQLSYTRIQWSDLKASIDFKKRNKGWSFFHSTARTWGVGPDKTFFGMGVGTTSWPVKDEDLHDLKGVRHVWSYLTLSYWMPMALLAILPVLSVRRIIMWRRQRWRIRNQCCVSCGYDLRASNDRCPECGTAIPPSVVT